MSVQKGIVEAFDRARVRFLPKKRTRKQAIVARCKPKKLPHIRLAQNRYHPHAFRHGCASNMMLKKIRLPVIQAIYLHVQPENLREALDG